MTVEKIGTGTQRERDAAINANFEALDTGKLDKTADSDYAKKSTTLSGYGITDAYTKTEVDNKITKVVVGAAAVLKTEFTASSANWGTLSDSYYPFTLAASGKHFLGMYRTNGSTYESIMVDAVESGGNIIIQSTEKFAGFILTI